MLKNIVMFCGLAVLAIGFTGCHSTKSHSHGKDGAACCGKEGKCCKSAKKCGDDCKKECCAKKK